MNDDTATPSPDEQELADILREVESAEGASLSVEEVLRRHPGRAGEVRELLGMQQALDRSRRNPELPMPATLGEFRIVRRLEAGGMADVYEARQESLGRRVAIKVMRRGYHSGAARRRFMREQQALARLHQTHIVPIHAAGQDGEIDYFVMPFIDGAALSYAVSAAAEFGSRGKRTPGIAELARKGRDDWRDCQHSGKSPAAKPPAAVAPFRPSMDYLRSVAKVIADAAVAVQHAHDQGILHRDLKPSNIMVESHGGAAGQRQDQCWVIDFGLSSLGAGDIDGDATTAAAGQPRDADDAEPPRVSGVLGTPTYMAPEQWAGQADERTDVWGLGVTLYELLTLRHAFPATASPDEAGLRQRIQSEDPPRPGGRIPRDLVAICSKAIRKSPHRRYAAARDLAADLHRWLQGDPVLARVEEAPLLAVPIRCARWARRNRGFTAAIGVALTAGVLQLAGQVARARTAERAVAVQDLARVCALPRKQGWSVKAWDLARRILEDGDDDHLREAFAATLDGIDAVRIAVVPVRASSLAFDDSSGELLLGGAPAEPGFHPVLPAVRATSLRAGSGQKALDRSRAEPGPVTCTGDGTRLQFVHQADQHFLLWDVMRGEKLQDFSLSCDPPGMNVVLNELHLPVLAMAANGSVVAAAVTRPSTPAGDSDVGEVTAWDALTGRQLCSLSMRATALALCADGTQLAVGDARGTTVVWSLTLGKELARLATGHAMVQALAIEVPSVERDPASAEPAGLRLAIGYHSGRITVWDRARNSVATCRGMSDRVLSLAFSPDGTLLAAAGEGAMLWDCVTGERLLDIRGTFGNAIAFSADGTRIAFADYARYNAVGQVSIWNIDYARGVRTLRGLDMQVVIAAFSPDSQWVAGLSSDWRIGIWSSDTGAPRRFLDAPQGYSSDNAGLAFSRDGTQIACLTGTEARLWDISTGLLVNHWQLKAGLIDGLAFDERDDLIAVRCEPREFAGLPPERTSAVVRVYNLSRENWQEPVFQVADLAVKVVSIVLDPGGTWFAVEGDSLGPAGIQRSVRAFDIPGGRNLWPAAVGAPMSPDVASLEVDPTGTFIGFRGPDMERRTIIEAPSGHRIVSGCGAARALGRGLELYAVGYTGVGGDEGADLYQRGNQTPFLRLRQANAQRIAFDLTGTRIAWGRDDGTVMLGDLTQIRRCREQLDRER